ncbi:MAG: hypothetical protein CML22_06640 [Rheinheimera sp.]|nr:hypothetical protein [Rheinheimera sp.]MBM33959.1 hypothetical protein [Rheinheimera sp.]|tara:strand:- start:71525 stop:72247 length:723 start_codon:yes stop_codon:yes gene_type:complete
MQKLIKLSIVTTVFLSLQACMTPIGKEEYACPNQKKGGVCAGPRDIYQLTNTRENLENIANEEDYEGYVITTDEDGNTVAVKREKTPSGNAPNKTIRNVSDPDPIVFEPREHSQHTAGNFQPAKVIPQIRSTPASDDPFSAWPRSTEPLAPEPLAVLEPPKVMRVLLASYKDARGNLNMPGYVYVQVEPETWSIGEAANLRPQRVVPTQVREQANRENQAREQRQRGVSPLETTTSNGGK